MQSEMPSRNSFLGDAEYTGQYVGRSPLLANAVRDCNQRLLSIDGKKKSTDDKRQKHYELLNTRIFIPLRDIELSVTDVNDYQDRLKLSSRISQLQTLPEYDSAKEHIDKDLPRDLIKPEWIDEQVRKLNSDIDDYFDNQLRNLVTQIISSRFTDIRFVETGDALPDNTVSFYGLIPKLTRLWVDNVDFTVSCNSGLCRLNNTVDFALIPVSSQSLIITTIDEIKNNPQIRTSIEHLRNRRRNIIEQSKRLSNSINSTIIFEIEHQKYKSKCKNCKKYSRWF
jgi:hypothetical protein